MSPDVIERASLSERSDAKTAPIQGRFVDTRQPRIDLLLKAADSAQEAGDRELAERLIDIVFAEIDSADF